MPKQLQSDATRASQRAARSSRKSVDKLLQNASGAWSDTQVASIRQKLEEMPETCRLTYVKAMEGNSLRAAADAFCAECMGHCDGWRTEVKACTALGCPLHPYRPCQ